MRGRKPERLDPWLQQAQDSTAPALQRFARRLSSDYDAVRAAVTLAWNNGQVEGQINRLKTLKRQMYGRAASTCSNAASCSQHDHQKWPRPRPMA